MALLGRGHNVRIVEERRNPVFTRTLALEGSAPARHVFEAMPDLVIHSYTPRTGARLMEWISRELSLVDVCVAVDGLPTEVARWIANLTHPTLVRAYLTFAPLTLDDDLISELEIDRFDTVLTPGQPAAPVNWESAPPTLSQADRSVGFLDVIPANLRDAVVEPEAAALAFEAAVARTIAKRYSTSGNSSNHSSNAS